MIANVGGTSQNWKKQEKKRTQITTMLKKVFLL
jgi:hypothetical protein